MINSRNSAAMTTTPQRLDRAIALLEIAEDQIVEARTELLLIDALETAIELKVLRTSLKKMLADLRRQQLDPLPK